MPCAQLRGVGRQVDGVLALLRALDVRVLAASRVEEITLEPFEVRAPAAATLRDQCFPGSLAGLHLEDSEGVAVLLVHLVWVPRGRLSVRATDVHPTSCHPEGTYA